MTFDGEKPYVVVELAGGDGGAPVCVGHDGTLTDLGRTCGVFGEFLVTPRLDAEPAPTYLVCSHHLGEVTRVSLGGLAGG